MTRQEIQARYRAFRSAMLNGTEPEETDDSPAYWQSQEAQWHKWSEGRKAIARFRELVADRLDALLAADPGNEPLVRRALGLPDSVPLTAPSRWNRAGQFSLFLLPSVVAGRRARQWLARGRTYEGRKLIFERFVKRTLPDSNIYYWTSTDFALRHFEPMRSVEDARALSHSDHARLRVAYALGVRTAAELTRVLPFDGLRASSDQLLVLVQEGVIRSTDELAWAHMPRDHSRPSHAERGFNADLRASVRCLLSFGTEREQVAGLVRTAAWRIDAPLLQANLDYLTSQGHSNATELLQVCGERLWRTPTHVWRHVVESVEVRQTADLAKFHRLLECHDPLSDELVQLLRELGADQIALQRCQGLLVGLRPNKGDVSAAKDRIRRLMSPPHSLSFEALSQCLPYLQERDLDPYLDVLQRGGFADAQAVFAFQACLRRVSAQSLSRCLAILGERGRGQPIDEVVDWVQAAGAGGNYDAFEYLVQAELVPDLPALRQVLKLVSLGTPLLRHLVEVRGLASVKTLRDWYYRARGIDGYRSWTGFEGADRVVLDDAFARNQFNNLGSNQVVVDRLVRERVEARLGPWPMLKDEAVRERYRLDSQPLQAAIRLDLAPEVREVLEATQGVLVGTAFEDDGQGPGHLQRQLERLTPLMDSLLIGKGPVGRELGSLDRDAVALVYRTPADAVQARWTDVIGREDEPGRLRLREHYPMSWRQVRWKLSRPLDRRGFAPLLAATRFAQGFRGSRYSDMFTACQRLSPKQLRDETVSASLQTLALHMGSLLAVVINHESVTPWLHDGFEALQKMDEDSLEAHQRLTALVDFLTVGLPDALDARMHSFVEGWSESEAMLWAERLGPLTPGLAGHDALLAMLQRCRERVIPRYLQWASRQLRRFKRDGEAPESHQGLAAMVSKHPAAFFARSAVQLCTADNVAMWREERLLHLVVFDQAGRRLAGMALLYVQDLPALDRTRPSLVLRAINPTDDMLAGHSAASIVESFFDVAQAIAQDNNLACVAFPSPTGMHLMSNRSAIETYLKERYMRRSTGRAFLGSASGLPSIAASTSAPSGTETATPTSLREQPQAVRTEFFAYEHGREPVGELHVIWRAQEQASIGAADQSVQRQAQADLA